MTDAPATPEEQRDRRRPCSSVPSATVRLGPTRRSLAISNPQQSDLIILTADDAGFVDEASHHYRKSEGSATDALIALKRCLRNAKGDEFWSVATRGIASLLGSQYAFISKRHQVDDDDPTLVLPPLGEPGSCLMGMSIYFNDGKGYETEQKKAKYMAKSSPCEYMKYDKVLLIPERLSELMPNKRNQLEEPPEAYLAVPLSVTDPLSGKDVFFAHFGVMWTAEGLDKRTLPYAFAELLLHGLSDLILDAFIDRGLAYQETAAYHALRTGSISAAVTQSQSLKPYAKSLSHELRTPMQGVVGMLDIMYGTVQEACEGQINSGLRRLLQSLKGDIEVVQDSARRAVEAADNVVLAYDMNMGVPQAPALDPVDEEMLASPSPQSSPSRNSPLPLRGHKRVRSSDEHSSHCTSKAPRLTVIPPDAIRLSSSSSSPQPDSDGKEIPGSENIASLAISALEQIPSGVRHTRIRDTIQSLVNDVVKTGGRPESAIAQPIDGGEEIEVRLRSSSGEEKTKRVRWSVDANVPEIIVIDERDLAGLISRVLHNAFKFTEAGNIELEVQMGHQGRHILIKVSDTGIGIPVAFMPKLFRPFSKEDDSLTRQSEGLGLGLMVAKGIARRLHGDLYAVRSETDGPNRGSVFEMRIPSTPTEAFSRPDSPFASPPPTGRHRSLETDQRQSPIPIHKRSRSSPWTAGLTGYAQQLSPKTVPPVAVNKMGNIIEQDVPEARSQKQGEPFPLRLTPCTSAPQGAASKLRPAPGSLASRLPLSFLVVEDNTTLRQILVKMLHKFGYRRVLQAYDGADAVRQMAEHRELLRRGQIDYVIDVVLMDIWMPSMNGYDAAERIIDMTHDEAVTPVILAVTADVTDDAMERVARVGMKGPLTKPYNRADLERCLWDFCGPDDVADDG